MTEKHTPGPWYYQEESDGYTHIVRGPSGCFLYQGQQTDDGISEANARLIAKAPEMLEALEGIVDYDLCEFDHHGYCQTHNSISTPCYMDNIRQIIAKAKGESRE